MNATERSNRILSGMLGNPTTGGGSSYTWNDTQTRIEVRSSGDIVNVFYVDLAVEKDVKRAEVAMPGAQR